MHLAYDNRQIMTKKRTLQNVINIKSIFDKQMMANIRKVQQNAKHLAFSSNNNWFF